MPKYIDADELLKEEIEAYMNAQTKITAVEAYLLNHLIHAKVQQLLCDAPAADVAPVRHRRWIGEGDGYADGELVYDVWHCSECDYCIDDGTDDPELLPEYCPKCGAKMDGTNENQAVK